ncbi:MAG TPA: C39 family peptidase [Anaerolineales bacterium]
MRKRLIGILSIPIIILVAIGIYFIPPVRARLSIRVDEVVGQVKYFFSPPEQAVFQPQQSQQDAIKAIVSATMQAFDAAQAAAQTPTAASPLSVANDATPTATVAPLPATVNLPGVIYVDQRGRWNYCGPANLTMALNFWGWKGTPDDVAKVIKPGENDPKKNFIDRGFTDKNVMPYEMVDFVNNNTQFHALYRYGGDIQLVKKMVAAGFPVIAEKGYYEKDYNGKIGWLGHYQFVTGYDDNAQQLIVQDTWNDGPNFHIAYDTFTTGWRSFDYIFIVVYPPDREKDVATLLGSYSDPNWAAQHALDLDNKDVQSLTGIDSFFAWFAKGTSEVALQQYSDAASAYDQAFSIYNSLGNDNSERPYRMMWYQSGPYFAYYYSGRYQDVIDLANYTLNKTIAQPTLEESLYWRGMAEKALGDMTDSIADFKQANYLNPKMVAIIDALQSLGITPLKPVQ